MDSRIKTRKIEIKIIGKGCALAELDGRNSGIGGAVWQALPFEAAANLWGEDVYFDVPLELADENLSAKAEVSDICFWSSCPAFYHLLRQTKQYSAVNHIGEVVERLDLFRNAVEGDRIVLKRH